MKRRLAALFTAFCLLLTMSGCSSFTMDVESHLRTPHGEGEQDAVQSTMEAYIYQQNAQTELTDSSTGSYVLKYPKMGDYRSAFVFKDMDNDGEDEALAFYAMQPEGVNTHIMLLKKSDGEWQCVDDIEGLSTEIERVAFGDLNGDGHAELLAGFSMYNTRDRRLMLYTLSDGKFVERYTDTYTYIVVDDITDGGHDDLLLFRIYSTEKKTTARLLSMNGDSVEERGTVSLDGQILQFGNSTLVSLGNHVRGVFQDCTKDASTTITELIIWDGQQLTAPLYDPRENLTTISARESGLSSCDVDDDGVIEWPQSTRLPGYETTEASEIDLWLSTWYTWDYQETAASEKLTCIVNTRDGYYLTIPDEWKDCVTASYDRDTRTMIVRQVEKGVVGEVLAQFRTVSGDTSDMGAFLFLASDAQTQYWVWYNKTSSLKLSMEQLGELFVVRTVE